MLHNSARERKRRLKKLYSETEHRYGCGVWYDSEKKRYIRYSLNNKWAKLHCRRCTRRRMNRIIIDNVPYGKGNTYKKYYDYQWTIF